MHPCRGMQCTEQLGWLLNYKSILCLFFYCFIGAGLEGFGILYSQAVESPQKLQYGAEHDLTAPGYINLSEVTVALWQVSLLFHRSVSKKCSCPQDATQELYHTVTNFSHRFLGFEYQIDIVVFHLPDALCHFKYPTGLRLEEYWNRYSVSYHRYADSLKPNTGALFVADGNDCQQALPINQFWSSKMAHRWCAISAEKGRGASSRSLG